MGVFCVRATNNWAFFVTKNGIRKTWRYFCKYFSSYLQVLGLILLGSRGIRSISIVCFLGTVLHIIGIDYVTSPFKAK